MKHWGPVILASLTGLIILYGLLNTLYDDLSVAPFIATAQEGRIHPHLKNVTRLTGPDIDEQIKEATGIDELLATTDETKGVEDSGTGSVPQASITDSILSENQKTTTDTLGDDAFGRQGSWQETIRYLATQRRTLPGSPPPHAVLLPAGDEDALRWSLPGAYWAVYSGAYVLYTDDPVEQQEDMPSGLPLYVPVPESVISDDLVEKNYGADPHPGSVKAMSRTQMRRKFTSLLRAGASDPLSNAVAVAEFRDEETGIGWGRTREERDGYFHYVVVSPEEVETGLDGLPLAITNSATLLYSGENGGLDGATDRYIWSQRAEWYVTPSEGPFRHFWILGNNVSYAAEARLDLSLEKSPYADMGSVALGPMEGIFIVYILLGLCGGLLVLLHALRLLPEVPLAQRIAWSWSSALLPVLGPILYFASYRRPRTIMKSEGKKSNGMTMYHWHRPSTLMSASATVMGFGYGAPLMIAIGYLFVYFGFPLFFGEWSAGPNAPYLLGAGMPIMMMAMYILAVLLAWPLVQYPMKRMMMSGMKNDETMEEKRKMERNALRLSLGVTALSMACVSLGMMTTAWWMNMTHIPMMPKEDEILWFGSMWLASTVGFLIAWPLNWPMIRTHLKNGGM